MIKNPYYVYGSMDLNVPVKLNFGDFIIKKILKWNEKIAVINAATGEKLSFKQIAQDAMNLAVSLTRLGVKKGDVIALCSQNQQDFLSAVIGITCTGAIVTIINVNYSKDEFNHALDISKPNHTILSETAYQNYKDLIRGLKNIIVFGPNKIDSTLCYKHLITPSPNNCGGLTKNVGHSEFEAVDVQGQTDTLFILYSSGTTELAKGVMLTHLNALAVCCEDQPKEELLPLTTAPWCHVLGLLTALQYIAHGFTVVYIPKFDVNLFLDTIVKYKITYLIVVPTVLVKVCDFKSEHDLSSVKEILSGAAKIHEDILEEVNKRFPSEKAVFQGYGMTETTYAVIKDDANSSIAKPAGIGQVMKATIIKVVDPDTRKPLGPNEQGEICVKGPLVMKGYIGKNKTEDIDDDGFFMTGDIGYYNEERCFFVVGRIKEVIKYNGYQVPPVEIEAVLLQHEAVRDAGVVGLEDRTAGEVPLAFVVAQQGRDTTAKELQDFVAERLSNPKHLRGGVWFVSEIPRNHSGKILRKQLQALAKETLKNL